MSTTTVLWADMMCGGCSKAITGMLKRVPGVENVETDVEQKRVVVTGTASTDEMIAAVKKTGKECRLWDQ